MHRNAINLLVLLGATAGGKTGLAVRAARRFGAEIISADSRQVYRRMDLGTGKDLQEYGEVPYRLIDIVEPESEYNLFRFQRDCFAALEEIWQQGKLPLLCGGTGMYLDAVLRGYRLIEVPENPRLRTDLVAKSQQELCELLCSLRPEQHNQTNLVDRGRLIRAIEIALGEQQADDTLPPLPELRPLVFGLRWPRELLKQRIGLRLQQRLEAGMVEEVQALQRAGVSWEKLEFFGLEYRLIAQFLQGQMNYNDMVQKLRSAIVRFAKKQETFFRRMERNGVDIHWLDGEGDPFAEMCELIGHKLNGQS